MEIDRQRLEEQEEQRRLLGQDSDSEESDTEDEENQQPPLTFPGTKTCIQGDVPVLPTHPVSVVVIRQLPIGGGSSQERGTIPHKKALKPVMPRMMKHPTYQLPERQPASCHSLLKRKPEQSPVMKLISANSMKSWAWATHPWMTCRHWEMRCHPLTCPVMYPWHPVWMNAKAPSPACQPVKQPWTED